MSFPLANSAVVYDSTSDAGESDASTCEDAPNSMGRLSTMARVRSLQQENTVLKIEVDTLKLRCKNLKEENEELRRARVNLQARAEQEEEYISNTLLRKIQSLKKEKEVLATTYEQEEEYLTNDLSRKLAKLREEKMQLEDNLEREQQTQIAKLMKKIEKLEHETSKKQAALDQLRKDKVDLENYLEQEQEQLVNKLWKQMDSLEQQKQELMDELNSRSKNPDSAVVKSSQEVLNVLDQADTSNEDGSESQSTPEKERLYSTTSSSNSNEVTVLTKKVDELRSEVSRLRKQLKLCQIEHARKLQEVGKEEIALKAEKLLLERKLAREKERSNALNKQLSESESSLEIDDERHFNVTRKSASSPIPVVPGSPLHHRSISGGLNVQVGSPVNSASLVPTKCIMCGTLFPPGGAPPPVSMGPASAGAPSSHLGTQQSMSSVTTGCVGSAVPTGAPLSNAGATCANMNTTPLQAMIPSFNPGPANNGGGSCNLLQGVGLPVHGGAFMSMHAPSGLSPTSMFAVGTTSHTSAPPQRSRLISNSSSTSQKSPRGSLLNDSTGSGQF